MELDYIRIGAKHLSVNNLNDLFVAKVFFDKGNDLFTDVELDLAINNFFLMGEFPGFGAIENSEGNVEFKTGKLQQLVNAIIVRVDNGQISPLRARKIKSFNLFTFHVIVEDYNPDCTRTDIINALNFYL